MAEPTGLAKNDAIPFEVFAGFERLEEGNPIIACPPPEWAAAAHAIVVDDTVHYLRGRREGPPKQTGLLVGDGDFGQWTRVRQTPVIPADAEYDRDGFSHPTAVVEGETIHIIYTGGSARAGNPTLCHATAPISDPTAVTNNPRNPVFTGTGEAWDAQGVRETKLLRGPQYFHVFYGGYDGKVWRIGHVRTRDFRTFEANPRNPIFTPSDDPDAWDCDGVLTPQVIEIGDAYYMVYAGMRGNEWQTGLAATPVT